MNKKAYLNLLAYEPQQRWDEVFALSNKIDRCGKESENGCECLQPEKIKKEGFATLLAEWSKAKDAKEDDDKSEKLTMKLTPEIVLKIFKKITDEDVNFMGFSSTWSRPEWMVCQTFAVPPPSVRPSVKHDSQQRSEDDITQIYMKIIGTCHDLNKHINENAESSKIEAVTTQLQYYVAMIVNNKIKNADPLSQRSGRVLQCIMSRINGKYGRIRYNLMGKRVDYSARSVITGDPNLSIQQIGVPVAIAKTLTVPEVVNDMNREYLTVCIRNGPDVHPGAKTVKLKNGTIISLRNADVNSIVLQNGDVVSRHLRDGDVVLFNRQPSLHKMSLMAHIAKVMYKGDTLRFNVGVTKPYNADQFKTIKVGNRRR
jgi:DNA-directed RNA polymerase II subunit RPB1